MRTIFKHYLKNAYLKCNLKTLVTNKTKKLLLSGLVKTLVKSAFFYLRCTLRISRCLYSPVRPTWGTQCETNFGRFLCIWSDLQLFGKPIHRWRNNFLSWKVRSSKRCLSIDVLNWRRLFQGSIRWRLLSLASCPWLLWSQGYPWE